MKVTHVITRLIPGGAAHVVAALVEGLAERGYAQTVISGPEGADSRAADRIAHAADLVICSPLTRDIAPVRDLATVGALATLLARDRCCLLHTHTSKAGFLGRLAGRLVGTSAIVHSPHGHIFAPEGRIPGVSGHPTLQRLFLVLERLAGRATDQVITLSEDERAVFVQLGISRPARTTAVYNGISLDPFEAAPDRAAARDDLGIPHDLRLVACVGRLASEKGHDHLIAAAGIAAEQVDRLHVILAGDGPLRPEIASLAAASPATIRLLGHREDVPTIFAACDLVAVPSLYEGLGIVAVEAMASGRPVVASRTGGLKEVVEQGRTGVLVPPGNPRALADAIVDLLRDPARAAEMGAAGHRRARSTFSLERMLDRVEAIYARARRSAPRLPEDDDGV